MRYSLFHLLSILLFVLSTITLLTQTWATISKFWLEGSQASMSFGLYPKAYRMGLYEICETDTDDENNADFSKGNVTCESVSSIGLDDYEQLKKMDGRGIAFLYFSAPACCLFSSIAVMMNGMIIGMEKESVSQLIENLE